MNTLKKILRHVRSSGQNTLFQAATFVPLAEIQSGPLSELYQTPTGNFADFINALFKFAIIIGAIAAVLRIAYAGYLYMGQSDMWSRKGEAKTILGDVTLGLLLLLSIWIILNQINPQILNLDVFKNPTPAAPITPSAPTRDFVINKLRQEHMNDLTPFKEYRLDFSPTTLSGYYCFQFAPGGASQYGCLTNEANCNLIAEAGPAPEKCTFTAPPIPTTPDPAAPSVDGFYTIEDSPDKSWCLFPETTLTGVGTGVSCFSDSSDCDTLRKASSLPDPTCKQKGVNFF